MTRSLGVVFAVIPDLVTASLFVLCWIAPAWIGPGWIKSLMLLMVFEFVCIHATAFLMNLAMSDKMSRTKRSVGIVAIGFGYLGLAAAIAYAFGAWWPIIAFLWLLVGKLAIVWEQANKQRQRQQMLIWGISTGAYIVTVLAGVMIPVPALMITDAVREAAELTGSGLWVDHPERMIFSGLLYFCALSYVKYRVLRQAVSAQSPNSK
ncbi:hypothetical protein C7S18_04065 [Ahniella affigens]|uniref:Uncharacterized protein n=1 Tax=Ahniella affigens TaxID=2021234 RepID=A0A2P1PNK4_9GAMM|nr:hypothetical protein [Ahniella affigens]AVP96419.1 hypothetical protein C7S18_04065 [Ahniella affigens]